MELFSEYEEQLNISWHPGCFRNPGSNTYSVGEIGRLGPGVSPEEARKPITISTVPSAVALYFSVKEDPTLFSMLIEVVRKVIKAGDPIELANVVEPRRTTKPVSLKIEYLDSYFKLRTEYAETGRNVRTRIKELEELGCRGTDEIYLRPLAVPENFYNYEEKYESYGRFEVRCDSNTNFYRFFKDKGLLDKYFPEWYRTGSF